MQYRFYAFKNNATPQLIFLLNVARITRFARQTCLMIRSRKERHFPHHAMVQTLFSFCQCLLFHIYPSLFLSLYSLFYLNSLISFKSIQSSLCVFTQHSILHFFFFLRRLKTKYCSNHAIPMQFAKNLNSSAF